MGLSKCLSPETGTLDEEEEASEGDTEVDAPAPWIGVGPFGDSVL